MWTWVKAAPRSLCHSTFELSVPWCSPPRWWSVDAALWRPRAAWPIRCFTRTIPSVHLDHVHAVMLPIDHGVSFFERHAASLSGSLAHMHSFSLLFFSIKIYVKFLSRDSRLRLVCLFMPLVCRDAEDWIKFRPRGWFKECLWGGWNWGCASTTRICTEWEYSISEDCISVLQTVLWVLSKAITHCTVTLIVFFLMRVLLVEQTPNSLFLPQQYPVSVPIPVPIPDRGTGIGPWVRVVSTIGISQVWSSTDQAFAL